MGNAPGIAGDVHMKKALPLIGTTAALGMQYIGMTEQKALGIIVTQQHQQIPSWFPLMEDTMIIMETM